MDYLMEEENYILKIALYIKVNLSTDKFYHKMGFTFMQTDLIKEEEFKMEKWMEMEYFMRIKELLNIKENGLMINRMDRGNKPMLMDLCIKENLLMAWNMMIMGLINGPMEKFILDNFEMDIWKVLVNLSCLMEKDITWDNFLKI